MNKKEEKTMRLIFYEMMQISMHLNTILQRLKEISEEDAENRAKIVP